MDARILIVDDARFMRRLLRYMLTGAGYSEIMEASDGEEAIRQFQEHRPDLVLLDITMPGMPGMEVLTRLLEIAPGTRIIICSAIGQETVIEKAKQAGACGFIHKPFVLDELLEAVTRALA